jgi:hypothetical protein
MTPLGPTSSRQFLLRVFLHKNCDLVLDQPQAVPRPCARCASCGWEAAVHGQSNDSGQDDGKAAAVSRNEHVTDEVYLREQ